MKNAIGNCKQRKAVLFALALPLMFSGSPMQAMHRSEIVREVTQQNLKIVSAKKINPTTIEVLFSNNQRMTFDFYGENIFRVFQDNDGGIIRDPEAKPEAQILVNNPRNTVSTLDLNDGGNLLSITTGKIKVEIDKNTSLMKVIDLEKKAVAFEEAEPVLFDKGKVTVTLKENPNEYFYGGGVQNGRFSHKGKAINIVNENSWTDGGVASPTPFYWSTNGYGMMWYTFKPGKYDFGAEEKVK